MIVVIKNQIYLVGSVNAIKIEPKHEVIELEEDNNNINSINETYENINQTYVDSNLCKYENDTVSGDEFEVCPKILKHSEVHYNFDEIYSKCVEMKGRGEFLKSCFETMLLLIFKKLCVMPLLIFN